MTRLSMLLLIICTVVTAVTGGTPPATPSQSASVEVIVEGVLLAEAAAAVQANGGMVTAELGIIRAVVAQVPPDRLARLAAAPGVVRITPNRTVQSQGEKVNVEFSKAVGLQEAWEQGAMGQGVAVAILDTGLDPHFPTLRRSDGGGHERILAYYDVLSHRLFEPRRLSRSPGDPSGHGTHVAGIIGNSDYEKDEGEYRGVAPAANLVAVRVLDENGVGTYADVIQGIEWIVNHKEAYGIRVLNVSLYSPAFLPYWADPLNRATMAAWQAGLVVVASAGNGGPDPMSIGVPGNTPYVITVGAFTDNYTPADFGDDYMPPFSATGPTLDAFVKPDLIAPGAHVISLMKQKSVLGELYPDNRVSRHHFQMAGTSMSAAVVSGIAALMIGQNPALTPDQVKFRLTMTARPQFSEYTGEAAYSVWEQGAGRVWAPDAVFTALEGEANVGMDIAADLAGDQHYEGWTVYDPDSGKFLIRQDGEADGYHSWAGGYHSWAGGYHSWAGGYHSWAGGTTNWSGDFSDWTSALESWEQGFNSWAGAYLVWSGGYHSWAGGYHSWAGGYHSWAGGYSAWAGGYHSWAGGYHSWAGSVGDPAWAADFANLQNLPSDSSAVGINHWVEED